MVNERVQYYGADGKLITESLKDYTRKNIRSEFASFDDFLSKWSSEEKKAVIMNELSEHGVLWEALAEEVGQDLDPFDLICHVAFDQPPLTRRERAKKVRESDYFNKYSKKAKLILKSLLDKYELEGVTTIESGEVIKVFPLTELGTPVEIVKAFGNKKDFERAIQELELEIYKTA